MPIKSISISVGTIIEIIPAFGNKKYITSNGKVFNTKEEAIQSEPYYRDNEGFDWFGTEGIKIKKP